jgi:hypothetical protein
MLHRPPGSSYRGAFAPLSAEEVGLRDELRTHVEAIAGVIGERNVQRRYQQYADAAAYITRVLTALGYRVSVKEFPCQGLEVWNLEACLPGTDPNAPQWILGAHYDTVEHSPGANDNTSAVAANLELARLLRDSSPREGIRFVFFANEEAPYFMTDECGSLRYARELVAQRVRVAGMLCLETIGCYLDAPGTQRFPLPLSGYPTTGDFITFVGDSASIPLLDRTLAAFRATTNFPSEGLAAPLELVRDIGRSDNLAFWLNGMPALMVTDTANFRYAHYHQPTDTPDRLQYNHLARVVSGLGRTMKVLAGCA